MTRRHVLNFIRYHGVVLQSAAGLEPTLTHRIVGEPIRGSWWAHPMAHEIFALIQDIHSSKAVLVCPLAGGKITYVHRRLWPYFVRLARSFPEHALDRVRQVHLPSGQHRRQDEPYPDWVPGPTRKSAKCLSVGEARRVLDVWLQRYGKN